MARHKGVKNKATMKRPPTSRLTPEERIEVLANLIVDRILEDQQNGGTSLVPARKADNNA